MQQRLHIWCFAADGICVKLPGHIHDNEISTRLEDAQDVFQRPALQVAAGEVVIRQGADGTVKRLVSRCCNGGQIRRCGFPRKRWMDIFND